MGRSADTCCTAPDSVWMLLIVAAWVGRGFGYHQIIKDPFTWVLIDEDLEEARRLLEEPNAAVYNLLRDRRWKFADGTELA